MPTFSNEVIIAGQPFELGGDIRVINFRENLDYSFIDPVGGSCAPEPGSGGPSAPIQGLTVQPSGDSGTRRRHYYRRGMSERRLATMSHEEQLEQLGTELKQAVIHHDATYTSHHCFTVLCRRGLSTHFMVNHDGGIIQGLDPIYSAYHAGDFNGTSIGIDMNNVATVEGHQTRYSDPAFGGVCDYSVRELVEGRVNRSEKTSFAYTDEQYVSLCALLRLIHEVIGLPLIYPMSDTGGVVLSRLTDPANFIGFFGHWHCQAGKWDPGPGFDWERVMEGLHGKSNHWPIDLGTESLRNLRSSDAVTSATDTFFSNIEQGPSGGGYPVGLNQEWHDGIHIYADPGTPVYACAEGEIILTRNGPDLPLGSPNYVLMRHKIDRERVEYDAQGVPEIITDAIWWYSLYMHLQQMDPSEVRDRERELDEAAERGDDEEEEEPVERREMPGWYQILVQRARESKAGPLRVEGDYDLEEARLNPRLFEERSRGLLRVQEFRHAYQCVEAGNPYRWLIDPLDEEEAGIPVGGGELLGYTGEHGELQGPRVEKNGMIQFQVFSIDPIFDDTRFDASIWRRLQGDLSGNSLVGVPEIVLPIQGGTREEIEASGPRVDLGRGRVLTPSEIDRFFKSGNVLDRHAFRTVIAQHFSEWDIANDDSVTANVQILWPWQTDEQYLLWRALHIGYKWLNDDTRDLLGMLEGPVPIYTYHPIYLLGWWTLNYGRSLQGQTFEGLSGAELVAALEEELEAGDLDAHAGETEAASMVSVEDIDEFTIHYEQLDGLDNGEWPPEIEFLHPLRRR